MFSTAQEKSHTPILQGKILEGSTVHTDGWGAYDELGADGYHYVFSSRSMNFLEARVLLNAIEAFRSSAKRRYAKFKDLRGDVFLLRLQECESWLNNKSTSLRSLWPKLVKSREESHPHPSREDLGRIYGSYRWLGSL
ncbi:MAG: transposase [Holosporales bacterium]|nr:transposase [Holosporales bacterium]